MFALGGGEEALFPQLQQVQGDREHGEGHEADGREVAGELEGAPLPGRAPGPHQGSHHGGTLFTWPSLAERPVPINEPSHAS